MDDSLSKEQNISMADINPKRLLNGSTPRLIDEWQIAPKLWDAIRFEVDPSIACASLGIRPNDLINDLKMLGFLLETLCVRDLRVYAQSLNGEVYHYRDKYNQEVDAVIHLRNGKYDLIEIKLGGDKLIEEGAKSLKTMERKINTDKMNSPSFLIILTGIGDYAYKRKDGILVVPIGTLKN